MCVPGTDPAAGIKLSSRYSCRGIQRCKLCGHPNGIRAQGCKNKFCALAKPPKVKTVKLPVKLDTVQLISTADAKLYSVQIRDRDLEHRSFVQITDRTLSSDEHSSIISRKAICFVDTCKYDSTDINISCKHVKNALDNTVMAMPLDINITVWYQMNLPEEMRNRIWKMYNESQLGTPIVQRINRTMFVIKCDVKTNFTAGRLHITLDGGILSQDKVQPK